MGGADNKMIDKIKKNLTIVTQLEEIISFFLLESSIIIHS